MVKSKTVVIILLVLVGGAAAYFFFFKSDEARIKRCFRDLSERVHKTPEDRRLSLATKSRPAAALFDEFCVITAPAYDIDRRYARQDISSRLVIGLSHYEYLSLEFFDFDIDFLEEGVARVLLTARIKGQRRGEEAMSDVHELNCVLKAAEDDWRFSRIEIVDVLEK